MIIDVHAHSLDRTFLEELARENAFGIARMGNGFGFGGYGELDPLLFDIDGRLEQVMSFGIDLQILSPPPRIIGHADWAADRDFARRLNGQTARTVSQGRGRLAGLAVLPLVKPQICVDELHRALDEGHLGIVLPTSVGGRMLDDPAYEPLFAECERLRCIAFMHPTTAVMHPAFAQYTMLQLVGWPTETALCVGRLIFSGLFERHPELRLVLAHGGGALAMLIGRMDLARIAPRYEANPQCYEHITRAPSEYLRNMYFDSMVINDKALRFLIDLVGNDRIVFGSDAPFEISDLSGDRVRAALSDQDAAVLDNIFHGTARRDLLAGNKLR